MALQLDGVRSIMAGIQQGAAIANMLRRAALDEEVMARDKVRMERENQMHDIQLQKTLQASGRPVEGNVVRDKVKMPGAQIPGMDPRVAEAIGVGDRLVEMARPVDKSRLMRTKLSDGREVAVEAFTQDELRERDLAERTAIGELLTKLKIGEVGQLREMGESPGAIAQSNQTAANLRAAAGLTLRDAQHADTLRSREQIAEDNRTFEAEQKDLDRKSREKAAEARAAAGIIKEVEGARQPEGVTGSGLGGPGGVGACSVCGAAVGAAGGIVAAHKRKDGEFCEGSLRAVLCVGIGGKEA